ncbi:DUF3934 family protein [Paenibacillus alkaliterrae]|uniref:DUF3934 family protein n=1 Tax=Paenibacillus alkaliterrae TaxID=320909 RepID=UPI001F41A0D7|nr:DUF3934 family protein [Paenibacillus alkaliterrae]MCF2939368.1 DUF3934 family protein [Paenibacillus alkaliterrae]
MSSTKGKGGTGRGTGKKGWNRWQASAKKKAAPKIFGRNLASKAADGDKGNGGSKGAGPVRGSSVNKGSNPAK